MRMDAIISTNDTNTVSEEVRLEWQEIARAEVSRHRRKLGSLTPQQESAVESALVYVANQLFEHLSWESVQQPMRLKCLNILRRNAVAA